MITDESPTVMEIHANELVDVAEDRISADQWHHISV